MAASLCFALNSIALGQTFVSPYLPLSTEAALPLPFPSLSPLPTEISLMTMSMATSAVSPESKSSSRFSDQPAPLRTDIFPSRPPPLFEWGDKLLGQGNLKPGFMLPTGANWSPALWIYGDYRTAIQVFDPGFAPRVSEWVNRLDLYANLQLSGLERILIGFRPLDRYEDGAERFTGYNAEPDRPSKYHGWQGEFRGEPTTFFFEGELGEIFPKLSQGDKYNMDWGFSVGRQPLLLQDGLLVNDDAMDMVGITRNTLLPKGTSVARVTGLFAWNEIQRAHNTPDGGSFMIGLDAEADFPVSTVKGTLLYVPSGHDSDGFYSGLSASQHFGKLNTQFHVANSIAVDKSNDLVRNGTLLFAEMSIAPTGTHNLLYLNGYWGIKEFSSADRGPLAGGPLGRVGLLTAASDLGRYGPPLTNYPEDAVGASLGYQMFFGMIPRTQFTIEVGGRIPTESPATPEKRAAGGIAARFQKAYGQRFVLIADGFGVLREGGDGYGARLEWHTKF